MSRSSARWLSLANLILVVHIVLGASALAAETDRCLHPPYACHNDTDQTRLTGIFCAIESAYAVVVDLRNPTGLPRICLSSQEQDAVGYFDPESFEIVLRDSLADDLLAGILLHEFRHVDQFLRGHCPSNTVSMQENARAVFAMEADASAVSLLAAWQLKEQGQPAVWNALSAWELQKDIAERFETEMRAHAQSVVALEATFEQWYRSDTRTSRYYISSCSAYLDRQDESHLLPSYEMLPSGFFEQLCEVNGGAAYPCAEP